MVLTAAEITQLHSYQELPAQRVKLNCFCLEIWAIFSPTRDIKKPFFPNKFK